MRDPTVQTPRASDCAEPDNLRQGVEVVGCALTLP